MSASRPGAKFEQLSVLALFYLVAAAPFSFSFGGAHLNEQFYLARLKKNNSRRHDA